MFQQRKRPKDWILPRRDDRINATCAKISPFILAAEWIAFVVASLASFAAHSCGLGASDDTLILSILAAISTPSFLISVRGLLAWSRNKTVLIALFLTNAIVLREIVISVLSNWQLAMKPLAPPLP